MANRINFRPTEKNNQNTKTGGQKVTHDLIKQQTAENLWLNYFNQTLYERGVINEVERNKMALKIENLPPAKKTRTSR